MADKNTVMELERKALSIRKYLVELCAKKTIHIGGDLSATDAMVAIWQYAMRYDPKDPKWEGRDRFVLSKGHAAAVTSMNQALLGCYKMEDIFNEYATDNGRFGMHSCNLLNPYVEVSTGSLGHGLPVGAGIAAALKKKGSKSRVFVVMGDGEQAEGSIWECALSAPNMKLGNLIGLVDHNFCSLDRRLEDGCSLEPLADKWRMFGWNVVTLNGNDMGELVDAFDSLPEPESDVPTVMISLTTKGRGVEYMENDPAWHMGGLTEEMAEAAKAALELEFAKKWGCAQ